MNIQIYSGKKNFDTQKAERYFKERKITCQLVDLTRKNLSKGELASISKAVGFLNLLDPTSKAYQQYSMAYHGSTPLAEELVLEHSELLRTPIVRNGRQATVGYCPDIWQTWE
jgi:arsenate reductase